MEQWTGLPIGMRAFRCAYASGDIGAGANLEDLALDFFEKNCRGCADRSPPGWLGKTIATLADAKRAEQEAREEADHSAAEDRRRAGESYPSAAQLDRVDRLDPRAGAPEAADIEWLIRTASLAPEVITDATVAELTELAQAPEVPWATREAAQAVLVPLATAGRLPKPIASAIALANLAEGPGLQAGKLLVAAADALRDDAVTREIARSVVELAGHASDPWARALSRFSSEAVVADAAPLVLCASRNLEAVLQVVEQMLASAAASTEPSIRLVGPDGQPVESPRTAAGTPELVDRRRSIAAGACQPLIDAVPGAAPRLVAALAGSLEAPDWDQYDAPPSKVIARSLAHSLRWKYADVAPTFVATAPGLSEEARTLQFGAVSGALQDTGEDDGNVARELVQLVIGRLNGDWGPQVAADAAMTLRDLARFSPHLLTGRAAEFVGVLITEITEPGPPVSGLVVPGNSVTQIEAVRRRQLRTTRISCLQAAIGHLVEAGADDAVQAVFSVLDAEDNTSAEAATVRAAATCLLGKIGTRPVHLPAVVPRLYTGLLHAEPKVRSAAIRSWADLASQPQPLPTTLFDLLPTLLTDTSTIVSVLGLITELAVPPERRAGLLELITQLAYGLHSTSFDGTEAVISGCIGALRNLAHGLPEEQAIVPLGVALLTSDRLPQRELRDLLTAWWPGRLVNSRLFAERALSVLATPELADYFNVPDSVGSP